MSFTLGRARLSERATMAFRSLLRRLARRSRPTVTDRFLETMSFTPGRARLSERAALAFRSLLRRLARRSSPTFTDRFPETTSFTPGRARLSERAALAFRSLLPRLARRSRATFNCGYQLFGLTASFLLAFAPGLCHAGIPEPDTVIFGSIALDGRFVTATDTTVVVEATANGTGPVLASYKMGSSSKAGNLYVLRIRNESATPILASGSVALGSSIILAVRDSKGVRDTRPVVLEKRGEFVQVNFGDVDTDGDGMSDSFERQYFGSATRGNPAADTDGDGRSNRLEAQQKTNPLVADGRHPADTSPADDAISIAEVTSYTLAWQLGEKWSVEPSSIPVEYVTRAGALWRGGEYYVFDNDPKTNAPMWWVNAPRPAKPASTPSADGMAGVLPANTRGGASPAGPLDELHRSTVYRVLPDHYETATLLPVGVQVEPALETLAYAVEETPPEGWIIRNISHQGRMDKVNKRIKWGPFYDTERRELTYELVPLPGTRTATLFRGVASFDGSKLDTAGAQTAGAPGGSPSVEISGVRREAETMVIELTGQPGRTYVIEASRDLRTWAELGTVIANASGGLSHRVATEGPSHYFRARSQ